MALLFLEAIGPEGERLALEAGRLTEIRWASTPSSKPPPRLDELDAAELEGSCSTRSAGSTPIGARTCAWPISGAGGRAASLAG